MKLNARLGMITGRIPHCRVLTDIGTDHAYIPIHAAENGLCRKSIAADLREGPLRMAGANIRRHGLENVIETRLGNGLEPILPEECDIIVIAGMGGSLIQEILSSSVEKAKEARLLLLQPNNATDVLRRWLYENGFEIETEALALDAGKLYCLISTKWTGRKAVRDDFDYYAGDILLKSRDPLLQEYIGKKIKELDVVIEGRKKSKADSKLKTSLDTGKGTSVISGLSTEKCMEIRNRLNHFLNALDEGNLRMEE